MDSYTQKLFSMGLGVEEPWYIRDLDFMEVGDKNGARHELHVYVEFTKGARFSVKGCDEPCPEYDTRERTWRHLNFFQWCYVHTKAPRVKTPSGEIRTVAVARETGKQDFSDVSAIGVDEYSHKGHRYITVFLSHQEGKGRVLFVTEG